MPFTHFFPHAAGVLTSSFLHPIIGHLSMISLSTTPAAQDSFALKQVWSTIERDSCPRSYNFHMHTVCSDGQLTPEALIEQAVSIGLQGLAITDHHSVQGYERAQRWLAQTRIQHPKMLLPHLWTGVEVTSSLEGTEVHILGYAFDPSERAMQPYLQGDRPRQNDAASVISALHQAGGLVVLAHPSRYSLGAERLITAAAQLGIDGVEAFYAYGNPKPWKPSSAQTALAQRMAQTYQLFATCGTDTHGLNLLQRI